MNLSYVVELPTAASNLNHRFKVLKEFESVIQIWTCGRQFNDPANSLNSVPGRRKDDGVDQGVTVGLAV